MTTTTVQNQTNDIRHSIITTDAEGNQMYISIRLNDECKNGHQDFAITADIYQKGKPKADKYLVAAGCCHDAILKACPELKIFVNLHLCDYTGCPMYAVENGFYHITEGFNSVKPESENFKQYYCDEYRITGAQFETLVKSETKTQFAIKIQELGILSQWKSEADTAISMLENMTGKTFVVDSAKTQFHAPTAEEIREEQGRANTGYYTKEAREQRAKDAVLAELAKLEAERDKEIGKATEEFEVKKQVLLTGGKKALDNCIYYNHSKTLSFNWRNYDMISSELYEAIKAAIILPDGVSIENKQGGK